MDVGLYTHDPLPYSDLLYVSVIIRLDPTLCEEKKIWCPIAMGVFESERI